MYVSFDTWFVYKYHEFVKFVRFFRFIDYLSLRGYIRRNNSPQRKADRKGAGG